MAQPTHGKPAWYAELLHQMAMHGGGFSHFIAGVRL
jgi:hypothetical protein